MHGKAWYTGFCGGTWIGFPDGSPIRKRPCWYVVESSKGCVGLGQWSTKTSWSTIGSLLEILVKPQLSPAIQQRRICLAGVGGTNNTGSTLRFLSSSWALDLIPLQTNPALVTVYELSQQPTCCHFVLSVWRLRVRGEVLCSWLQE